MLLLLALPTAAACTWIQGPPPTRYLQVYSPDETWLAELDRTDGTLRVYRTVDPFHAVWSARLTEPSGPEVGLAVLDGGVVLRVRERVSRADQPVVTLARADGVQTWTVAELGGELVTRPAPAFRDTCQGSRPRIEWLEHTSVEGDWLVVDTLTGPPRRLPIGG